MPSCVIRSCCRLFSTAPSTSSEALQLLQEKIKTYRPTSAQLKVIEEERPFALAPEVVCHTKGFVNNDKMRHNIYLEWLEDPNLNVGIEMTGRSTYAVDVKAVFYALVWAHYQNKNAYVSVYSRNEIVTKCAQGKFNAKASAELFDKIKAKLNGDNSILRGRVSFFAADLAAEKGITNPETRPEAFPMMTEGQFLQIVSSSLGNSSMLKWEQLVGRGAIRLIFRSCSTTPSSSSCGESVIHVQTTGYTYKHRDGRTVAKYGMYFGKGDARNRWEEIHGQSLTFLGARLYAIIQAIKTAYPKPAVTYPHSADPLPEGEVRVWSTGEEWRVEVNGPKIRIQADYDVGGWKNIEKLHSEEWHTWTTDYPDFRQRRSRLIANSHLWEELYHLVYMRQEKIILEYCKPPVGERNPVTALLEADAIKDRTLFLQKQELIEFIPGDALEALAAEKIPSPADWPTVFTGGFLNWFSEAGYATVWPEEDVPAEPGSRLNMYPVTLYRAELCAILQALKQARLAKLEKIVVVTSCPYFLTHWNSGWKKSDGRDVANSHLYNRIYHMVKQEEMQVVFRYLKEDKTAPVWKKLHEKCLKGLQQPMMQADKFYPSMEEILERKCPEDLQVRRVRHFKRKRTKATILLWDKRNSSEETIHHSIESSKTVDALLAIASQAKEEDVDRLLIRTDSKQLIKEVEQWMPVWKRNDWRSGRNTFQDPRYEQVDELLSKIQIYWELVDPPTAEDLAVLEQFTKPKKSRKVKVAKTLTGPRKRTPKPMIQDEISVSPVTTAQKI